MSRYSRNTPQDTRLFIDGECRDALSGNTLTTTDPATGEVLARVGFDTMPDELREASYALGVPRMK